MTDMLRQFEDWFKTKALPFWATSTRDKNGGVFEFLTMDGRPNNDIKRRVRVQARFAYTFAHAAKLGWYDGAKRVSDHAWDYLMGPGSAGAMRPERKSYQGCANLLNPDGSLYDAMRDTYAQAFVILAGAWRFMAFGDKNALTIAKQTVDFLDQNVKADNGGWLEGEPATLPRRQNPHMHMFEAFLALYDTSNEQQYLDRAGEIFQLFKNRFFNPKNGVLLEFFDHDWQAVNGGGPLEPGHMMEWCWLLREYADRSGENVDEYADALFASALRLGLSPETGLLYDGVDLNGRPRSTCFRIWPQLELIKAAIAQTKAGKPDAEPIVSATIKTLFNTYLNVDIEGGWADQFDDDARMISDNMPTSTAYHMMCTVAEVSAFTTG